MKIQKYELLEKELLLMVLKNSCFLLKSFDRNHYFSVSLAFLTVIKEKKYDLKMRFNTNIDSFYL